MQTSLLASFVAGMAALFAPCCISVLLPSYFGSVFQQKKKVFVMTFIFFLGIATVFLPMGLGIAAVGQFFSYYHNAIFLIGGSFLALMGIILLSGKHYSLPFSVSPKIKGYNAVSIYILGIFSAIATTCCAPVLAGVMALAVLPGSIFWGGIFTLSYVLGMVAPLFIIAFFLDRINFTKKFMVIRKPVTYSLLGKKISITVAEAISGIMFLAMGIYITYLAYADKLFSHSDYQVDFNISMALLLESINKMFYFVPEYVWAVIILALAVFIVKLSLKNIKEERE